MSLMTNILAVLGVILIIVLVVYVYRKYRDDDKKKPKTTTPDFPPDEYMKEVGTKCPDLWSLTTNYIAGSPYKCENVSNVPVANGTKNKAYDCAQNAVFKAMPNWPLDDKVRQKELKNRCEWIEKCGPAQGTPASWIGIDDLC